VRRHGIERGHGHSLAVAQWNRQRMDAQLMLLTGEAKIILAGPLDE
jgi:hypothetical protein